MASLRPPRDVRCEGWPEDGEPCGWRGNQEQDDSLVSGCPECGGLLADAITGETFVDDGDIESILREAATPPFRSEPPRSEPVHTIYFYYDADGRLLYLGVTGQAHWRARQHNRTAKWWPLVVRAEFWHFKGPDAKDRAYAWERRLIGERKPLWNVADNPYRAMVEAPF